MSSTVNADEKLDAILEKLNLARLDTILLNSFLLPTTLLCIGLIVSWVASPPLRTLQGLNALLIIVEIMVVTFFVPLVLYAYAYIADNMKYRLGAVKSLVFSLPLAASFGLFVGVETLEMFLKSRLPQFTVILDLSISGFVLIAIAFAIVACFGFSYFVLTRLDSWLRLSIPRRVERDKLHLSPFLGFFVTIHPLMFSFFVGVSVVGLVAFYLFWTIAILITSPLSAFWQEPLIAGWLFSIVPLIGFLATVKRLGRAYSRNYKDQTASSGNGLSSNTATTTTTSSDAPAEEVQQNVRKIDRTALGFTSLGLAVAFASNLLVCNSQCTFSASYWSEWMTIGILLLLLAFISRSRRYSEQYVLLAAAFITPLVIPLASALFELLFLSVAVNLFMSDKLCRKSVQSQRLALSGVTICFAISTLAYMFYESLATDWWRYILIVLCILVGGLLVIRTVERSGVASR